MVDVGLSKGRKQGFFLRRLMFRENSLLIIKFITSVDDVPQNGAV